ncbi:hypothetical protein Golomagni_03271 [Golovinomyces magnicellulatus]|nr:hypothetical protein Golomagni_03271 [Golovinomyces magnicellulatus]
MFRNQTRQALRAVNTVARQYATPSFATSKSPATRIATWSIASVAVIGGVSYLYWPQVVDTVPINKSIPAFTGQGFINLKLENVENINHNTKKLRFALPEKDQVSGLQTASCLLTKFKGPEMEKAVIRPYTPTSDEGLAITSIHKSFAD